MMTKRLSWKLHSISPRARTINCFAYVRFQASDKKVGEQDKMSQIERKTWRDNFQNNDDEYDNDERSRRQSIRKEKAVPTLRTSNPR